MGQAASPKLSHCSWAWLFLVCWFGLLVCPCDCLEDAHSLGCNFTVTIQDGFTSGETWFEVWCSLDEAPFLKLDNVNKATPQGELGKEVNGTEMWADLIQRLEYLMEEFKKKLPNIKQDTVKTHGDPTLEAIMISQQKHGQIINASWRFIIGKDSFLLDTVKMHWTLTNPEATEIMEEWKSDKELTTDLKIISSADCSHWLKELLKHHKEKPRSTMKALDTTQPTSATMNAPNIDTNQLTSPSQHPPASQDGDKKGAIIAGSLVGIAFITTVIIYKCVKKKCSNQGDSQCGCLNIPMQSLCTNLQINCCKQQREERTMEAGGEFPDQATKMLSPEDELTAWGARVNDACRVQKMAADPLEVELQMVESRK